MNPYEAQQITTRLRLMSPPELMQFGELHKGDPNVFPLVFNESNFRKSMSRNQQMQQAQQGAKPPVNEQALAEMQAPEMPEDVGIGALPAGNMEFANGGIVAFADGGETRSEKRARYEAMVRAEAERRGVDPEHMLRMVQAESAFNPNAVSTAGAAGLLQLMPGTAGDMGLTAQERFDPQKSIEGGTGYFKQLLDRFGGDYEKASAAYNWGPNRRTLKKDDWKLGLPKETADYLTRVMPMGAAQAAAPAAAPAAPAAADASFVPTVKVGEGYTPEGLEALGQRLDAIRAGVKNVPSAGLQQLRADPESGARYAAAQQLRRDAEAEYQQYAGKLGLDKPAFMKPSPQYRSVVADATPVAKQLAPDALTPKAPTASATPDMSAYIPRRDPGTVGPPTAGPAPAPAMPPAKAKPAEEKAVIAAAKKSAPDDVDTSGFTREDWLTLGFSLLSSKSPRFVEALGESGLKMVAGRQARTKMGQDAKKTAADIAQSEAQTRY